MKYRFCWIVGLFGLALTILPVTASAQAGAKYAEPVTSACVSQLWDTTMYGWLAYQNNCGQPIHLMWYGRTQGGGFSADVRIGGKTNTGFSRSEVNNMGGFALFVCPGGYIPVDSTGLQVHDANATYRCKKS